jgi:hypothetical protein
MCEMFEARLQKLEMAKESPQTSKNTACYESYYRDNQNTVSAGLTSAGLMGSGKGSREKAVGGFTTIHDTERAAPMESELANNLDRFANLVQRYNFAEHVSEVVDIDALVESAIEDRAALDQLSKC